MAGQSASRTSLRRVLDDLGRTVLDLVIGSPEESDEIGGVAIFDPLDKPILPARAIVLGVGVHGAAQITDLLDQLAFADVAALVVRAPVDVDTAVAEAAERSGIAVFGLTQGASWTQIAALLRLVLADDEVGLPASETVGSVQPGDLFALANAVSALVDAPITIEDRGSHVLAFSSQQDEADPSRIETILGRQAPERYSAILEQRGIFHEIYRRNDPVFVDTTTFGMPEVQKSRTAVAIRGGDEIFGSMWALTPRPLSAQRLRAFHESAGLVALHLLRQRTGADVTRRVRADLLGTVLRGEDGAGEAAERLGVAQGPCIVLALGILAGNDLDAEAETELEANRLRVANAFALHLSATHPRAASALIGGLAYGILPISSQDTVRESAATRIANEFIARKANQFRIAVGIGRVAEGLAEVRRSRHDAERVVRVLHRRKPKSQVGTIQQYYVDSLLLELADAVAEEGYGQFGGVARLRTHDRDRRGELTATLSAWLESFGDVVAAAERMNVHQNTFRYRLNRIAQVSGLDLTEPSARFAAMVELRLLDPQ